MPTPVLCREALARRDEVVEKLGSLPAVPTALDQIVQHFGTGAIAEFTGRSRLIVRRDTGGPVPCFTVENRPGTANCDEAFDAAWEADMAKVAAFSTATLHIVTGLLLSIWRLLPQGYRRVYRLQSGDGEHIVGRGVAPSELSRLCRNLDIDHVETITSDHAWRLPTDGPSIVGLGGNMTLRRVRVMNDHRVERTGFTDGMGEWMKVIGLFSEIIARKTRFFVPITGEGPAILSRPIERHRLVDVACRH